RYVAEFIGSPAMNIVPALRGAAGATALGLTLPLAEAQRAALVGGGVGGSELAYGVRPEDLQLTGPDAGAPLPGTLAMVEPTGPETYAMVDTPLGTWTARVPGKVAQQVGEAVSLAWAPGAVHLFDAVTERRVA